MKKYLCIFFFVSTITLTLIADNNTPQTNNNKPNILLISIDGLQPNYILNAEKYDLNIPNLKSFIKDAAYAPEGMIGVMPTMTFPSHAAMMTGTNPMTNGIENNTIAAVPEKEYNFFASDKVDNLWTVAKSGGYITANLGIPVSIGAKIDYDIPTFWNSNNKTDLKYINQVCEPKGLVNTISKKIGTYTYKLNKDNYLAADIWKTKAAEYLLNNNIKNKIAKTGKPLFMSMYFLDLDNEQHNNGLYTKQTKKSIEAIDKLIGNLIASFKKTVGNNTVINIVSDHGFVNISKEIHINTALKNAGFIELNKDGKITNWEAYACYAAGMCGIMINNPEDKKLCEQVYNFLLKFVANPKNGISKIYTKDELINHKAFPSVTFALSAKHGFKFNRTFASNIITNSKDLATHGYPPDDNKLHAAYFIKGVGIPKNKSLKNIKLIDVAPTLAKIMNIKLKTAEGKAIF